VPSTAGRLLPLALRSNLPGNRVSHAVAYLINQGIGCIQIMLINHRRLHADFHVGIWLYAGGLAASKL
jgi:hypothetical protein